MQQAIKQKDNFITDSQEQVKLLHGDTDGWITLARKKQDDKFQNYHYKIDDINSHVYQWTGIDGYVSMNTFYTPRRLVTNLRELRSLYVDLDCYNVNLTPTQVVMALSADYFDQSIPTPNLINYSGRGINLIWFLEPLSGLAIERWDRLQKSILKTLEPFGSDAASIDAARIFRLTGSTNSKNNATVETELLHTYRYDFNEVVDEYFEHIKEPVRKKQTEPKKAQRNKSKVKHLFNEYSLIKTRMQDIKTLISMRNNDFEGFREVSLFLYRYWSIVETKSYEKALEATHELNNQLNNPLPHREVQTATRSAEMYYKHEEGFNISNEKIMEWLDIQPEEEKHLKTIISKNEKKRRKAVANTKANREKGIRPMSEYNAEREQQKMDKLNKLKILLNKGYKQRQIADTMGISTDYIKKLKRQIKEGY